MESVRPEWHNEHRIEAMMRSQLEQHGWKVTIRSAQSGADIQAVDPYGRHWVFEAKGYPSTFKKGDGSAKSRNSILSQRRVWFIEALGQILTRMKSSDHQYALVFPDHPTDHYFQEQTEALPQIVRQKLDLWIFLLSESGALKALRPDGDHFEEWQLKLRERGRALTL